ncbi:hypothetical protein [Massilia endophytica]|nr:hypothetical protein [Massilia endophytica]
MLSSALPTTSTCPSSAIGNGFGAAVLARLLGMFAELAHKA